MVTPKNCIHCGVLYGHNLQPLQISKRKFCSKKCEAAFRKLQPSSKKEHRNCLYCNKTFEVWTYRPTRFCSKSCSRFYLAGSKIERTCLTCGSIYKVKPSHVKHRGSNYCSKPCFAKGISQRRQGANNVNYRGGTVTYRGRNWGTQSRAALKRDGYICQICHKKLNRRKYDYGVHHIIPYREFNHDWQRANDLSNLISLCRSCHTKVEFGNLPCPKLLI